jgi:membrane associated rhomboid family serine protease
MGGLSGECTWLIIAVTCLVSFLGFRSRQIEERYIFCPETILAGKEYYRLITAGFLHADWNHLFLNMLSLYLFGPSVEFFVGRGSFLLVYLGAIMGGNLLSLYMHRHHDYRAYGASGGVCGMIFAFVLLWPSRGISLFFIPFYIPGWLYAIGFMAWSFFGMRAARDHIGHDAHLGGAIVGLLIAAGLQPEIAIEHWKIFGLILGVAVLLLVYVWVNPMFLPVASFARRGWKGKKRQPNLPRYKQETARMDAILEKISKQGIQSLTEEEKKLLDEMSGKYRRRSESEKPKSDLAI